MFCAVCYTPAGWVAAPTGGWWAHVRHPADGHDAVIAMDHRQLTGFLQFVESWLQGAGFYRSSEHVRAFHPDIVDIYLEDCCQPADLIHAGSTPVEGDPSAGPRVRPGGADHDEQPVVVSPLRHPEGCPHTRPGLRGEVQGDGRAPSPEDLDSVEASALAARAFAADLELWAAVSAGETGYVGLNDLLQVLDAFRATTEDL